MELMDLLVPTIVASVVVFIASSIAWMVLPHHKKDIKTLPDEKALLDHLATLNIEPGTYMWPGCREGEPMNSPEARARYEAGPWGSINIQPSQPSFGRNLFLVFCLYFIISLFVAYITSLALPAGARFWSVFQVAGCVAVLGYCAGPLPGAIFMGKPGRFVVTDFLDNLVYGILTGLVFSWMWPTAEQVIPAVEAIGT